MPAKRLRHISLDHRPAFCLGTKTIRPCCWDSIPVLDHSAKWRQSYEQASDLRLTRLLEARVSAARRYSEQRRQLEMKQVKILLAILSCAVVAAGQTNRGGISGT